MFLGEYHHTFDDKGRIVIPNKYRTLLGESFIIAKGLEKCLYIYSNTEWNKLVEKLNTLPFTKKDARTFIRTFFSGASVCEIDKQGRINAPEYLLKYASITKECIILGANSHIELWSNENYEAFMNEYSEQMESIAETLFTEGD